MTGENLAKLTPSRVVLEGVPFVGFYDQTQQRDKARCPEDVCFPSSMRAVLEYLGEPDWGCKHAKGREPCRVHCTYSYLMGVTGCAFQLSWRPGWHEDNVEIMYMSDDPMAPFARAFRSVGYGFEVLQPVEGADNEAAWRQRIGESIRRGVPALAFGVIGPPECCVVTGYDEDGDVLIGWNCFQQMPPFNAGLEYEPTGEFRKRDWFKDTQSPIIVGEKQPCPPLKELYRDALQWALQVARTPLVTRYDHAVRHNGLAAYTAWAEHLERDSEFATEDMAALWQRFNVHDSAVGVVAEGRWYGGQFLMEAIEHLPYGMAEDLLRAAACYAGEHDLMWQIWDAVGGIGRSEDRVRNLARPEVRRKIAALIVRARDKDAEAAEHIERALSFYR
ncbi:MAG: hypothetical protein GXY76_20605 [Chloroflexi bacterium]|nr:hypothetical protein [Chloroflexota bacterium]